MHMPEPNEILRVPATTLPHRINVSPVYSLRLNVVLAFTLVFAGCQSYHDTSNNIARIAKSLERHISAQEARHIVLDYTEGAVKAARANTANPEESRQELEILTKNREQCSSRLESFLSRLRKGDELWVYRTYVSPGRPCGEMGFARVRRGKVVAYLRSIIFD